MHTTPVRLLALGLLGALCWLGFAGRPALSAETALAELKAAVLRAIDDKDEK